MYKSASEEQTLTNSLQPATWGQRLWYVGRSKLLHELPVSRDAAVRILEVGCGLGQNLVQFAAHFVNAQLVGLEQTPKVVSQARTFSKFYQNRIDLYHSNYAQHAFPVEESFDVLFFSYQLSRTNQTWEQQLRQAYRDLKPGGIIAVLDFHSAALDFLRRRLQYKHQHRLNSDLLPHLKQQFAPLSVDVCRAYGGLWEYFFFVGMKPFG